MTQCKRQKRNKSRIRQNRKPSYMDKGRVHDKAKEEIIK